MNDKLTAIKIRQNDGTYSNQIPITALAKYIEWDNDNSLIDILGNIDIQGKGNVQYQLNQLFNTKINVSELNNYVYNTLEQTITNWLESNIEPIGDTAIIDKSLSVQGAAADAKAVSDTFYTKTKMNQVIAATTGEILWQFSQGTNQNYHYNILGNKITINGSITNHILRIFLYGPLLIATGNPKYSNSAYQKVYLDPITSFTPGHRIKAEIKLISGTYSTTEKYYEEEYPPYLDLRDIQHGENAWTLHISNNYENIITFQPQMICCGFRQGTYENAVFEFSIKDMDSISGKLDQLINNLNNET